MAFEHEDLDQRREAHRQEKAFMARQKKLLRIGFILTAISLVLCAATLLITGFDSFVVVLVSDGKQQMIYKHAISTLAPMKALKAAGM